MFRDPLTWITAIVKYRFTNVGPKGNFFSRYSSLFTYLLLFIFCFLSSGALLSFFGGPLRSPDSVYFESMSVAPWKDIGNWHPAGVSFLLFLGAKLGLDSFRIYQLLWAFLCVILFYVLQRGMGKKWALLSLLVFFLDPVWVLLRITLWSELPFILMITLMGALLSFKRAHWPTKVFLAVVLFLVSCQFRLVGIFFWSALFLGLGFVWQHPTWVFRWQNAAIAGIVLFTAWLVMNRATTGKATHVSNDAGFGECKSLIVSLNRFPYCDWNPSLPICSFDPRRVFLNNPLRTSSQDIQTLQFDKQSPILKYVNSPGSDPCALSKNIFKLVLSHAPVDFAALMATRIWNHFGSWEWTERSNPRPGFSEIPRIQILDQVLSSSNQFQMIFQIFLVLVSAGLLIFGCSRPELIYFWIGALGHAAGVSFGNPFLVLRYMAISKYLVSICFIFWVFDFGFTQRRRVFDWVVQTRDLAFQSSRTLHK